MKKYRYILDNSVVMAAEFWPNIANELVQNGDVKILDIDCGWPFCRYCKTTIEIHGVMDTEEGLLIVHPGDMVVKDADGELWPWSRDGFNRMFDAVDG